MCGYHEDPSKITFDRAEVLADRYIKEYSGRRERVTSSSVAQAFDVDPCHHNLIRITKALGSRLEVARTQKSKPKQYKLP